MEQTTAEVTRQMEEERRDLDQNLAELKVRAKTAIDWRDQVNKRPAVALGAALVGGMLLAGMTRRRGPRTEPAPQWNGNGSSDWNTNRGSNWNGNGSSTRDSRHDAGQRPVSGALMAAATTAIAKVLSELVPGFRDEHEQRTNKSNRVEKPAD